MACELSSQIEWKDISNNRNHTSEAQGQMIAGCLGNEKQNEWMEAEDA